MANPSNLQVSHDPVCEPLRPVEVLKGLPVYSFNCMLSCFILQTFLLSWRVDDGFKCYEYDKLAMQIEHIAIAKCWLVPVYPSMGPLFFLFQALLFNQPSVHLFLFEPLQVFCHWVILSVSSILLADRFPVFCISDPRRGIIQESLEQSVWRPRIVHSRYYYLFLIQTSTLSLKDARIVTRWGWYCSESRSRMRPGWKICLLILDICIGYFIKRFKVCIAGSLDLLES